MPVDFAHGELVNIFVMSLSVHSAYGFCQNSAANRQKADKNRSPVAFFIAISGLRVYQPTLPASIVVNADERHRSARPDPATNRKDHSSAA
jgi:hypothetical protein